VVAGVGPGNGEALARRFAADGYRVALLARSTDFTEKVAAELEGAKAFSCDVTDPDSVSAAFDSIRESLGEVEVLLYNAGSGVFGSIEELEAERFEGAWKVNTLGLVHCAKQVIDPMKERGRGSIVVTGATASLRGGARFAAFAQAKAAQRSLAQSMARHLGPAGIHVAIAIVDGVVDLPRTRESMKDAPDEKFLKPAHIAESVHFLAHQERSAWTFELDLRPHVESW